MMMRMGLMVIDNPNSDEKLHCHICSRNFSSRWDSLKIVNLVEYFLHSIMLLWESLKMVKLAEYYLHSIILLWESLKMVNLVEYCLHSIMLTWESLRTVKLVNYHIFGFILGLFQALPPAPHQICSLKWKKVIVLQMMKHDMIKISAKITKMSLIDKCLSKHHWWIYFFLFFNPCFKVV